MDSETPQERKARLNRERQARFRQRQKESSSDDTVENQAKKQKLAENQAARRENETSDQRQSRLELVAQSAQQRREQESVQERSVRLGSMSQVAQQRRQAETPEQREIRLCLKALAAQSQRSNMSQEEHELQLLERRTQRQQNHEQLSQVIRNEVLNFNEAAVDPHSCNAMNVICRFCSSKNFPAEKPSDGLFTQCCRKGKLKLPKPLDVQGNELAYPAFLQDLMINPANSLYKKFRDQIRSINNAVSFASMGADIVDVPGRGPYVFKIHGQTHHKTSYFHPPTNQTRKYAQLYVIDSTQALSVRNQHVANTACPPAILDEIDRFFRQHNRLAQTYQMIREIEERETTTAAAANLPAPQVSLVFRRDRQSDQRRYNDPTANEIAMVFVNEDGEPPFDRDIRIYPRNVDNSQHQFVQINILSPNLDPMTYAVLFPYGEPGWQPKWRCEGYPGVQANRVRTNVSMLQFKVAQTAIRNDFNPIVHAGKLFQQWIVDSYLQVEANNLNFIRLNQKKLRTELYQGLVDHIGNVAANQNVAAGVPVILPSSFSGSPRNMREQCCDAMALFAKHGAPDLFITFTANPSWKEIVENLAPGETASDRPDLVARVFKIKLDSLLDDIVKHGIFGTCTAFVYTIEFQKRSLPHAHCLFTLRAEDKFTTADRINQFVSAEIPSNDSNPRLREIVLRTMMHGPCGADNPFAPCMENRACKKNFPKSFVEITLPNINGYPVYRRRRGERALVRNVWMDNRHVVPYSPYLTVKYNAHINVEVCTSLAAIKYIYKYIFKGFDCANIAVTSDGNQVLKYDEITNYLNCRYVSAPEAMWRLRENKMHDRSHTVMRLPVHLPGQQVIRFEEGNEQEAIVAAQSKLTQLESFFELNKSDSDARRLIYIELPEYYVYATNKWKPRQRGANKVVTRMYSVSPKDEERLYLRTLLLHVRGPQSFEDVRTFEGTVHQTFKAAAIARGLLESDDEWVKCLEEAVTFQMPRQLRDTFAFILCFCHPARPIDLWEQFKDDFALDFARTMSAEVSLNLALHSIEATLKQHGLSCASLGLPVPEGNAPAENNPYDIAQEAFIAQDNMQKLNPQQREAFDTVRHSLDYDDSRARCYYLDGPGGSGKTFLYTTLLSFVRGRDQTALAFATTGIAATLLKGGRTVHSGFKLPVPLLDTSVSSMRQNSNEATALREASLIVIDEITMLPKDGLRCIDQLLRDIMKNDRPFGGKVLLIGGDFRQTLPVVPRGNRADIIEACIKSSPLWSNFRRLTLSANMRSAGHQDHNEWLLKLGEGTLPKFPSLRDPELFEIPQIMVENTSLIDAVFSRDIAELSDEQLASRVIVAATNAQALVTNREIIRRLPGESVTYHSADSIISEDPSDALNFPNEFLNGLTPSGVPPHELSLKRGTIIMLLRNLCPKKGLCNGTRLVVEQMARNTITARILSECNKGDVVIIPRIILAPSDTNLPFVLRRRQFPVIPAFCITMNKSQGQTYDKVGIDFQVPVFGHGQAYVAFSRARDGANIRVRVDQSHEQGRLMRDGREFTRNVVFNEVFRM